MALSQAWATRLREALPGWLRPVLFPDSLRTQQKKAIVTLLLSLLTLWPLAHHGITRTLRMDSWRFFGFAMYSNPKPYVRLQVRVPMGDQMVPIKATSEIRQAIFAYGRRRSIWGRLAPPHSLAEDIFALRPHLEKLEIVVRERVLDRESAHLHWRTETYRY